MLYRYKCGRSNRLVSGEHRCPFVGPENFRPLPVRGHPRSRVEARHLHVRKLLQRGRDAGQRNAAAQADVNQLREL